MQVECSVDKGQTSRQEEKYSRRYNNSDIRFVEPGEVISYIVELITNLILQCSTKKQE